MTTQPVRDAAPVKSSRDRRSLMAVGTVTAVLAGLHLVDHALRGRQVDAHGLDPAWNHSGWPAGDTVTPYTFSLVAVALVLVGGLVLTGRGKAWAGYWLGASLVLGAIVTVVHFLPTAKQESPSVIYNSWPGRPVAGAVAVAITFSIVAALVVMAITAVRVRRRSGTWT